MQTALSENRSSLSTQALAMSLPVRLLAGFCATMIIALAAHIAVPLPFTPIPLTLQPLAVLGVGLAFGPVGGFLTLIAYLVEGIAGLPVFSPAGPGGALQLCGFSGGFLMAYPFVAAITGGLTRALQHHLSRFVASLLGCTAAVILLFACGAFWFAHATHASAHATWIAAVAPYLPGEAVKICVAAGIYSTLSRARRA
jgi:biotin transport system substrate-specific component